MEKTLPSRPKEQTGLLRYETENYRVIIGKMSGPEDLPEEMRVKYIIQHKKDGVIYGVSGGLGAAIIHAQVAEKELAEAADMAIAEDARLPRGNGTN